MHKFWAMCGLGEEGIEGSLDNGALRGGLDWLASWDVSEERRALKAPILALASEGDRIVRKPMTEAAWGDGNADLRWLATDSHILPVTHAEWCAEQITGFIDDFDGQGP
jgi:pimeloyl-ACP methyl ester carboxylesterase